MSSTYGRNWDKQKAAGMAACRWGNLEKMTVQNLQCQFENRNLKDAETQTEITIALSSPANFVSSAYMYFTAVHT